MEMKYKLLTLVLFLVVIGWVSPVWAADEALIIATEPPVLTESPAPVPLASGFDPLKYTLGPDDAVDISVMRHPEFSGVYPINAEGKIQYKFVGDMEVVGLTKAQLEQRIRDVLSVYIKDPEVSVTVTEYKSKYFYVLGQVAAPGKYYMRGDTITVREAVFEAGLPRESAAMRKCQLITPSFKVKPKIRPVNLYEILYGGNLKLNINMSPGDIFYVPSTVMAKVISVISPVSTAAGVASAGPESASTARTAADTLSGRPGR
jgi:polysaccharide export outer membrane protein